MNRMEWGIRVRSVLDRYVILVVVGLVFLALFGGYVTYTAYAEPTTRTETVQTASWQSSGEFEHSATVLNGTEVYDRGETLSERRNYFRTITPLLDGTFRYRYTATDGGDLRVDTAVVLVYRSVSEADDGTQIEYWRTETQLGSHEVESLSPGEPMEAPFSVNVSAAQARLQRIDEQVGTTPGQKQLIVEARVDLGGTRNGRPVETRQTYRLPISVAGNVYTVEDPGTVTEEGAVTDQRTFEVEPSPFQTYGGPALLALALVAGGGLLVGRSRNSLSVAEREREWLAYRNARTEFDDWITVANTSGAAPPASTVEVQSLDGLVDVAIDSDRCVIESRDRNRFVVFGDDRTYVYEPPASPTEKGLLAEPAVGSSPDPPEDDQSENKTGDRVTPDASDGQDPA